MSTVTLPDGRTVRLGRIRPKARPYTLRLSTYLGPKTATNLPASVDYTPKAKDAITRMYLNDSLGDCVMAGVGHAVGVWTANASGTPVLAQDSEIRSAYRTICGIWDQGCVITEVLDYMKDNGITLGGQSHKIDGYVSVDWSNQDEVKAAIYIFGVVKIGINLPSAWANTQDGDLWDMTNTRFVGGHDVECFGYNDKGVIISTWGGLRTITWAAFTSKYYLDEAYALLSPDWYAKGKSPSGFDVATLKDDLQKIGGGTIPPIDPTPEPPEPTPKPAALTLEQAVAAIQAGIASGQPYGTDNVVAKVQSAAIDALTKAWTGGNPPTPIDPSNFDIVD